MHHSWNRREFLKAASATAAVVAAAEVRAGATPPVPRRPLGRTGRMVSCLAFGGGSRFCSVAGEEAAQALLHRAFAAGINYFDTASSYGKGRLSERRYGEFLAGRRAEVFLTTKLKARGRDEALREVEESLKCLRTDHVDLVQIHSLLNPAEVEALARPDSVLAAVRQLREQKVARFIGITSHNDGDAMAEALRRYDFDTALMALNAAQAANPLAQRKMQRLPAFEQAALPAAVERRMGIIAMKVMAQGQIVGTERGRAPAAELLQYGLSLPVSTVVIGYDRLEVLEENIRTAIAFTAGDEAARQRTRDKVAASQGRWQRFLERHDDCQVA